jgi:uncharacterized protein YecE (DUF72 family)
VFAVKASRYLTHVKRLKELGPYIKRFYDPLEALVESGRLGPVLWQLPENFHRDDERLAGALEVLPKGQHGVALVIGDHPKWPFQAHERTADWTFIRFHYGRRGRNGRYSDAELDTWARRLAQWRRKTEVFAYFNNDWSGYAVENAKRLKRSLGV